MRPPARERIFRRAERARQLTDIGVVSRGLIGGGLTTEEYIAHIYRFGQALTAIHVAVGEPAGQFRSLAGLGLAFDAAEIREAIEAYLPLQACEPLR